MYNVFIILTLEKKLYLFPNRYKRILNYNIGQLLKKIEAAKETDTQKTLKKNLATLMKPIHFLSLLHIFFIG